MASKSVSIALVALAASFMVKAGVHPLRAQGASNNPPQFEVASVKPNKSLANRVSLTTPPGGRFDATNVSLRMLILFAYELQDFQLVGVPDWTSAERFDIVAKGEGDAGPIAPERWVGPS